MCRSLLMAGALCVGAWPALAQHQDAHAPAIAPVLGRIAPGGTPAPVRVPGHDTVVVHGSSPEAAPVLGPVEPAAAVRGARRAREAAPTVSDVAASINARLAQLAELRRTMPNVLRRPSPKKAAAVTSPEVPAEPPRPRVRLEWRVLVAWPDELRAGGTS